MSRTNMVRVSLNRLSAQSAAAPASVTQDAQDYQAREWPEQAAQPAARPRKAFSLHIGADLRLPTGDAKRHSSYEPAPATVSRSDAASDPFAGLPFKALADRLGDAMSPVVQAVREDARTRRLKEAGLLGAAPEPSIPTIPHILPFTRWAAGSEKMKSTFVIEEGKDRKRARLSWYHPDDTMVPRGWWKMGLLEDLKYYRPFQ